MTYILSVILIAVLLFLVKTMTKNAKIQKQNNELIYENEIRERYIKNANKYLGR